MRVATFLQEIFEERQERNHKYSKRAFSRDLGLSQSYTLEIMIESNGRCKEDETWGVSGIDGPIGLQVYNAEIWTKKSCKGRFKVVFSDTQPCVTEQAMVTTYDQVTLPPSI